MRSNSPAPRISGEVRSALAIIFYPTHYSSNYSECEKINDSLTKLQSLRNVRVNPPDLPKAQWRGRARDCRERLSGSDCGEVIVRPAVAVRRIQQLANPAGGHWPAEQIALRLGHRAVGTDQLELLVGFDAFDHHRHPEIGGEPRHPAQQCQRAVAVDSFKERSVDLDFLQWEVVEVAERRISRAEIVERDPHPEGPKLRQHVVGQLGIVQQ